MRGWLGLGLLLLLAASPAIDASAQSSKAYGYDELGRLVTVTPSTGSPTTYGYDHADNRTSVTSSAAPPTCNSQTIHITGVPTSAPINTSVTSSQILALCTDSAGYTLTPTVPSPLPHPVTIAVGQTLVTVPFTVSDGHGNTASNTISYYRG